MTQRMRTASPHSRGVAGDRAAHAQHLVVGVRGDHQHPTHPSTAPTGRRPPIAAPASSSPSISASSTSRAPSPQRTTTPPARCASTVPTGAPPSSASARAAPEHHLVVAQERERARVGSGLRPHPGVEERGAGRPVDDAVGRRPLRPGARPPRVLRHVRRRPREQRRHEAAHELQVRVVDPLVQRRRRLVGRDRHHHLAHDGPRVRRRVDDLEQRHARRASSPRMIAQGIGARPRCAGSSVGCMP